jgi:hypothetical protein
MGKRMSTFVDTLVCFGKVKLDGVYGGSLGEPRGWLSWFYLEFIKLQENERVDPSMSLPFSVFKNISFVTCDESVIGAFAAGR